MASVISSGSKSKCRLPMTPLSLFIRRHRRRLGLTQADLARRVGCDATYINAIETGRRRPDGLQFLGALAVALELGTDDRMALGEAATLSKRSLRVPDALTAEQREVIATLMDDLKGYKGDEMALLKSVLDVLRRRSASDGAVAHTAQEGGESM